MPVNKGFTRQFNDDKTIIEELDLLKKTERGKNLKTLKEMMRISPGKIESARNMGTIET